MCISPTIMRGNPPLSHPSQLAFTPAALLKKKTTENAKLIHHLEALIRAEKIELSRLLASDNSILVKRARSTRAPSDPTSRTAPHTPVLSSPFSAEHPATPEVVTNLSNKTHDTSPRAIMHSFDSPSPTPSPSPSPSYSHLSRSRRQQPPMDNHHTPNPEHQEMAARGSHWSFVEKARFEAALHKYGPFAWDDIIKAVATRTDKQVKAYAARYRRRKKFAARMQALPMQLPSASTPMPVEHHPSALSGSLLAASNAWDALPGSDVHTEPSLQSNSDGMSSAPSASAQREPVVDIFGQELSSSFASDMGMDQKASVDTSKLLDGDLLDDAILGSTGDDPVPLSEGPSEVDLLVDRAINGQVVIEGDQDIVQLSEDPYPTDFLGSLFDS